MILTVKVSPGSKKTAIRRFENDILYVCVTAPPEKGRANEEVIGLLAERLNLKKNQIEILSGATGKLKRIKLPDGTIILPIATK
jgi:uncharacterized protein (TIGR00251 family)